MRITDLSKDELLYIISNIGFIYDERQLLRIGLQFRANSLFEQGQAQHNIATHKLKKYMELLSPYSGQKLADIPIEIIKESEKTWDEYKYHSEKSAKLHDKSSAIWKQIDALLE